MDVDTDAVETVEFLSRSATRVRILATLAAEEELPKGELRDRLDASRTTIQRNLAALADRGLVVDANHTHAITRTGKCIVDDYTALLETVRVADELAPAAEWVDTVEADLDPRDFEVTTPDPADPMKAVNKHVRNARDADTIRIVLPFTGTRAMKTSHDRLDDRSYDIEIVCPPEVVETYRSSPEYRDYYAELKTHDGFALYVTDEEIPYYLGLLDDGVEIGLAEGGQPTALLESDAEAVFEWAEAEFEAYRADAERVDDADDADDG